MRLYSGGRNGQGTFAFCDVRIGHSRPGGGCFETGMKKTSEIFEGRLRPDIWMGFYRVHALLDMYRLCKICVHHAKNVTSQKSPI